MSKHGTRRFATRLVAAIAVWALLCCHSVLAIAIAADELEVDAPVHRPVSSEDQLQDVIIAGGLDGRVYAMNAWTGSVLWMFDSGGPMVDFSNCVQDEQSTSTRLDPLRTTRTASVDVDGRVHVLTRERSVVAERESVGVMASEYGGAGGIPQLFPSYNGHLFHLSKNSEPRELEMTMVDIINANGPVRLVGDEGIASEAAKELSQILLVGDKKTKLFRLDAKRGLMQPYFPSQSFASLSRTILFGRSKYCTKAVHLRNASETRCFAISEYFLQFSDVSRCTMMDGKSSSSHLPPKIVVIPRSRHDDEEQEFAEGFEDAQEGSIIAAFDPWTDKPMWEFEIPDYEVTAVFGVSAARGSTFYQWSRDGPSSTASKRHSAAQIDSGKVPSTQAMLPSSQDADQSKQVSRAVSREWHELKSRFRLRKLSGHYYVESMDDTLGDHTDSILHSTSSSSDSGEFDFRRSKRRRPVFWESMENDGKKGVFISYYHVGAMMLGITFCCMVIAWGCYFKGLSASFAQSAQSAIKSMESPYSRNLMRSHMHQLKIEGPDGESVMVSSIISGPLLMDSLAMENVHRPLALADSHSAISALASQHGVDLDPETEAQLMEQFARIMAKKAASRITGSNSTEEDDLPIGYSASVVSTTRALPMSDTNTTKTLPMSESAGTMYLTNEPHNDAYAISKSSSDDDDTIPIIEELESSSSSSSSSELELMLEDDAPKQESSVQSADKSGASVSSSSWSSGSTGGSCSSVDAENEQQNSGSSSESSKSQKNDVDGSQSGSGSVRKQSNASSSSSNNNNDAEVLFPFVCQSRFANEFVEIQPIGKGGFGQVILAENRLDGRKYAIKRVGLNLKNQTSKTLQKFLREVKILALLDHPSIVRYYQAWLEKVDDNDNGVESAPNSLSSDAGSVAFPKNYSTSNLLAPITEMEFTHGRREDSYFGGDSFTDGEADDGFEWERNSSDGVDDQQVWKDEDLVVQNSRPNHRRDTKKRLSVVVSNSSLKEAGDPDDSTNSTMEKCDHWLYIQMQYCAGRNLGDFLALPNRTRELPKLLKIFVQIASALAHVHSCGLIHRDLKPANIFVADTEGESIKLGDFGLSRYAANVNVNAAVVSSVTEEHTQVTMTRMNQLNGPLSISRWTKSVSAMSENGEVTAGVGTYLYASPEQVAGKKYNARTDMYSLGMILFELCHEPFTTTMERYVTLRNARDCIFPEDFQWRRRCPDIMDMLEKLLHRDAMARPTAEEVVKWSQDLYEASLVQQAMAVVRSPVHQSKPFHGMNVPSLDVSLGAATLGHAFMLQVEAKMETCSPGANGENSLERRLPNHNLLKEICDIIEDIGDGKVEIKKCGLHLQDEGVQILEFVLDPHDEPQHADRIIASIRALPSVQLVTKQSSD
ncbi:TPA: hypothetical protein N0F65_001050 [Lagenidium giganteum]|uniref:non-specific serine/threonine protein kinase n=1 Tax=Lagenidium giganteum TaxID=4803 RepID=A0AAV2YK63_9STRA|nr:TPA: hypothetical protein N0F65_001050 [Lagenidium giganteum]